MKWWTIPAAVLWLAKSAQAQPVEMPPELTGVWHRVTHWSVAEPQIPSLRTCGADRDETYRLGTSIHADGEIGDHESRRTCRVVKIKRLGGYEPSLVWDYEAQCNSLRGDAHPPASVYGTMDLRKARRADRAPSVLFIFEGRSPYAGGVYWGRAEGQTSATYLRCDGKNL